MVYVLVEMIECRLKYTGFYSVVSPQRFDPLTSIAVERVLVDGLSTDEFSLVNIGQLHPP